MPALRHLKGACLSFSEIKIDYKSFRADSGSGVYWYESCPEDRAERFPLDGPAAKARYAIYRKN